MSAEYRGYDSRGIARVGVEKIDDMASWVEAKFRSGWRFLSATVDGVEVGRIDTTDSGRRGWWAGGDR